MTAPRRRFAAPPGGGRARGSPRCPRCRMHVPLCLCAGLPRIETETQLTLWTHVVELERPTNTGRLATLCLPEARVVAAGGPESLRPELGPAPERRTYVLYPGPEALVLDKALAHEDPRPLRLIVPDGTWSQTRRFARQLASWPRLVLPSGPPTRFRLRDAVKAPERICTLEAIARALGVIEGHHVEAALLGALERMVERTLFTRGQLPADEVSGGLDGRAHALGMSRNS